MSAGIRDSILEIIRSIKEAEGKTIERELTDDDFITDAGGLDSLNIITLILRVEEKFRIDAYKHFINGGTDNLGEFAAFCQAAIKEKEKQPL